VNRTLRNALIGTVAGGALITLPAVALGAATGSVARGIAARKRPGGAR
jgi:hypothetical protein